MHPGISSSLDLNTVLSVAFSKNLRFPTSLYSRSSSPRTPLKCLREYLPTQDGQAAYGSVIKRMQPTQSVLWALHTVRAPAIEHGVISKKWRPGRSLTVIFRGEGSLWYKQGSSNKPMYGLSTQTLPSSNLPFERRPALDFLDTGT